MSANRAKAAWQEVWECLSPLAYAAIFFAILYIVGAIVRSFDAMATFASAAVAKGEAFGLLEFWINRYQTLSAGLIAIAAALIGGGFVLAVPRVEAKQRLNDKIRGESEAAKLAACMIIAQPVHAAATAAAVLQAAIAAQTAATQDVTDQAVSGSVAMLRATLSSFTIQEGLRNLNLDDRVLYLATVATLSAFVTISDHPPPGILRLDKLNNLLQVLLRLHRYLRPFDAQIADVFERDSGTRANT